MTRWLMIGFGALIGLAFLGFLVAASGIIPIKASSGHWPITEWLLKFGMHRSFATHSLGVKVPPLEDPALVLKGATHYDFGCRSCHGSPGTRQPRVAQHMTPPAPDLQPMIRNWNAAELFTLVKHGVKFTGMPGWVAPKRDDEVWAVVAFLQKLPELDRAGYERLVHGEPTPTAPIQTLAPTATERPVPEAVNRSCVRCHGHDGLGRGSSAFPKLAGQKREYLEESLLAYATGRRASGIMQPLAAGLTEEVIRELAAYYAGLPGGPRAAATTDAALLAQGRDIAENGVPARRVPACVECHGSAGRRTRPVYPLLHGQPAEYLELQLELFRQGARGGTEYAHLMQHVAPHLTAEQSRAVAHYFASLAVPEAQPKEGTRQ